MFTVYILRNNTNKRFYTGSTNNLTRRITEHNRGQTKSTRYGAKWVLVYKEEYKTNKEAKSRERVIKSYKSGGAFKKLMEFHADEVQQKNVPPRREGHGCESRRPLKINLAGR